MPHVEDDPECPCYDCKAIRLQQWRLAFDAGATIVYRNGLWIVTQE